MDKNKQLTIGEIVERLIYIKDNYGIEDLGDLEAINNACNILDHRFNRFFLAQQVINEHITSIIWQDEDIKSALEEDGFDTCEENVAIVINSSGLEKYLQERGTEAGWDVIHNAISELSNKLVKKKIRYKFKISELHGMIKDKFYIVNKNDENLCTLDVHPGSNTGLPMVFNTEEEAEHYLSCVEDMSDAIIKPTMIHFFDNGAALYEEDENGMHIFSF